MAGWQDSLLALGFLLLLISDVGVARNVAVNSSCVSSVGSEGTVGETLCRDAIDGVVLWWQGWRTAGSIGEWLHITFDDIYRLTAARLLQLVGSRRSIEIVGLLFENYRTETVVMSAGRGPSQFDELVWQEVSLSPAVCTDFVRIEIEAVLPDFEQLKGFVEVEFHTSDLETIWRVLQDPLQSQRASLETCFSEHLIVTRDDVSNGDSLMMIAPTSQFHVAEVFIRVEGIAYDFGTYTCGPRPAAVMTLDAAVGRMGAGHCLPLCTRVGTCFYDGVRDQHAVYVCTCPYENCVDITLSIPEEAIDPGRDSFYFEDIHVVIVE